MLYTLLTNYSDTYSFLNFFNFLTVRTGLAILTAMKPAKKAAKSKVIWWIHLL